MFSSHRDFGGLIMVTTTSDVPRRTARGILISTIAGKLVASVSNVLIGLAALAAGADPTIGGMLIPSQVCLSIAGVLGGAIGWALVRRVAARPGRVLRVLVPVVFLLSLVPLVGLGLMAGTAAVWTAMVGLGIMHLVTIAIAIAIAIAIPVYRRFLPL